MSGSEVAQSCPTPSDPMDCSLPGSSVHGMCQARVLEWVAIVFFGMCVYSLKKAEEPDRNRRGLRPVSHNCLSSWPSPPQMPAPAPLVWCSFQRCSCWGQWSLGWDGDDLDPTHMWTGCRRPWLTLAKADQAWSRALIGVPWPSQHVPKPGPVDVCFGSCCSSTALFWGEGAISSSVENVLKGNRISSDLPRRASVP